MKPAFFRPAIPGFRSFFDDFLRPMSGLERTDDFMTVPAVNVKEENNHFLLEVAAPGMNKADFKITVEQGLLSITAEKQASSEDKTDNYTRREFRYASFKRSFQLPEGVKETDIKASYTDGVLSLEIPKVDTPVIESGRTIPIN